MIVFFGCLGMAALAVGGFSCTGTIEAEDGSWDEPSNEELAILVEESGSSDEGLSQAEESSLVEEIPAGQDEQIQDCGNGPRPDQWDWPVPGYGAQWISSTFNPYWSGQYCSGHWGIDIATGGKEPPIVAAADGKVIYRADMWCSAPYPNCNFYRGPNALIVQHAPNFYSTYSHNSAASVNVGDCVTRGQEIAAVGTLGNSTGEHLHFEIIDGTPFTGDCCRPFNAICDYLKNPMNYVSPP